MLLKTEQKITYPIFRFWGNHSHDPTTVKQQQQTG